MFITLAEWHPVDITLKSIRSCSSYGNRFMMSLVYEHSKQCMPCSSNFQMTLQTEILPTETWDLLKLFFSSHLIPSLQCFLKTWYLTHKHNYSFEQLYPDIQLLNFEQSFILSELLGLKFYVVFFSFRMFQKQLLEMNYFLFNMYILATAEWNAELRAPDKRGFWG